MAYRRPTLRTFCPAPGCGCPQFEWPGRGGARACAYGHWDAGSEPVVVWDGARRELMPVEAVREEVRTERYVVLHYRPEVTQAFSRAERTLGALCEGAA